MKKFFKCTLSALAVSAVVVLALLSSGCNKNPDDPDLLGSWTYEFYDDEWGGKCDVEYIFSDDGLLTAVMTIEGESYSIPMLWRVDGNKLYALEEEVKHLYKETETEWPCVDYKIIGNTLTLIEGDSAIELTKTK